MHFLRLFLHYSKVSHISLDLLTFLHTRFKKHSFFYILTDFSWNMITKIEHRNSILKCFHFLKNMFEKRK